MCIAYNERIKREKTERLELFNNESIWTLVGKNKTKLQIPESITNGDERKRETSDNILKQNCRNIMKRINTWVVYLVRYSGSFLNWTRKDKWNIEQWNWWLCTKSYTTRYDIHKL